MTDKVLTRRAVKKEIKRLRKLIQVGFGPIWTRGAKEILAHLEVFLDKFK